MKSRVIRVHVIFYDALEQMRKDLEKLEEQLFPDTELTRRIGLRIKKRRGEFAKKKKW